MTYVEWGPPVSGHHQDFYDDVLVSGLVSLPTSYLDSVGVCHPSDLQAYNPDYFLGWEVALPDKPLPAAWKEAYQRALRDDRRSLQTSPARRYAPKLFHASAAFGPHHQACLCAAVCGSLPRYKGKPYRVVIHGRSGAVHGESPLSWVKVTLLVLALLVG